MKKILTILLLCVAVETSYELGIEYKIEKTISFRKAYNHVRKWEGNYSNLEFDKGGETYGGIARNFNKQWNGWYVIDKHKKDCTVYWNKHIPEVEEWVLDYYYEIWINDNYYLIKNQTIANYIFDYRNTGIIAYKHVQLVLQEQGYKIKPTGKLDIETINALNKINPSEFIVHLQKLRKNYYLKVADRNPELQIYIKGWINRAKYVSV